MKNDPITEKLRTLPKEARVRLLEKWSAEVKELRHQSTLEAEKGLIKEAASISKKAQYLESYVHESRTRWGIPTHGASEVSSES